MKNTTLLKREECLEAWYPICVSALMERMSDCATMLAHNSENIFETTRNQIWFQKENGQVHSFNIPSYKAMEEMILILDMKKWSSIKDQHARQLLKALYWVSEEHRADRKNYSFEQLISCLETYTFGSQFQ